MARPPARRTSGSRRPAAAGSTPCQLSIRVADTAAGEVTLTSDFPELRGAADTSFTFNVTLSNGTAAEATFSMNATGPAGWTVTAEPSGQAQATTLTVAPGGTGTITVTAGAPADAAAATYPINLTVIGGGNDASLDMAVTITGTYTLDVVDTRPGAVDHRQRRQRRRTSRSR